MRIVLVEEHGRRCGETPTCFNGDAHAVKVVKVNLSM